MARRSKRGFINTQQVLDKLEQGRAGAIQVCKEGRIGSPSYKAAHGVTQAIDDLAEELTGDRTRFHLKQHGIGTGQRGTG